VNALSEAIQPKHRERCLAQLGHPGAERVRGTHHQGLTLVNFSAQLERFVWDRGCTQGLCIPC